MFDTISTTAPKRIVVFAIFVVVVLALTVFAYASRDQGMPEGSASAPVDKYNEALGITDAYDDGYYVGLMLGRRGVLSSEITDYCQQAVYEVYPAASWEADDALKGCKAGWDKIKGF